MGKAPAIVIVARHGARLDAADNQWHLTSPTPYDPPLTFGGWTQARALGTRIANILKAREEQYQKEDHDLATTISDKASASLKRKRRKHDIIIHSSPFVRCIQTSIAISAGIGQSFTPSRNDCQERSKTSDEDLETENNAIPMIHEGVSAAVSLPTHQETPSSSKPRITTLRVDAFLGEWLSPDYYEQITPPPSSVMMVAGAKSELLRHGETPVASVPSISSPKGHFPGGWGADMHVEKLEDSLQDLALGNFASPGNSLPTRSRANTETHGNTPLNRSIKNNLRSVAEHLALPLYNPPSPAYAISSSGPIPTGFVAHARDACVNVDYQWDSMRPPYEWGDGGEYGEEWGSMHKRFRNGLEKMIAWYKCQKIDANENAGVDEDDEVDGDTETVLVLVTHGAGCNALIGALTNQPVLLDVAMASLTMAERKPPPVGNNINGAEPLSPISRRRTSLDNRIATEYDVKIVASTEHLRGRSTVSSPVLPPTPRISSISTSSSHRTYSAVPSVEGISLGEPMRPKYSAGNGVSHGRKTSLGFRWSPNNSLRSSSGLWGSIPITSPSENLGGSTEDFMPNFDRAGVGGLEQHHPYVSEPYQVNGHNTGIKTPSGDGTTKPTHLSDLRGHETSIDFNRTDKSIDEGDHVPDSMTTPKRAFNHGGLWSSTDSPVRSSGAKRRWTVTNEHPS